MKKIILAAVAVSLMSTSAFAWVTGTLKRVEIHPTGPVIVVATSSGDVVRRVSTTAELQKQILAVALTAQSRGATVDMLPEGGYWTRIRITE